MLALVCAALVLAAPVAAGAAGRGGTTPARAHAHQQARRTGPREAGALERARLRLSELRRDPVRRRQRVHWERAIAALERAAHGRDASQALLEAARARYALYRWSQDEADREAALRLALRARRAGAREAAALTAAIRREMGDDGPAPRPATPRRNGAREPRPPSAPARPGPTAVASSAQPPRPEARPGPRRGDGAVGTARALDAADPGSPPAPTSSPAAPPDAARDDEDGPADPALQRALAAGAGAGDGPAEPDASPPGAPAGQDAAPLPRVTDVRSWSNADYTRVVVYLTRAVPFTRRELPVEAGRPRRLALDLEPARLDAGMAHAVGDSLVDRVRAAQHDGDTVRVVLDLPGRDDVAVFTLADPPRLVVDVGARAEPPLLRAPLDPDEGERRPVRRIVVDAGHGGHDTGAIGPTRVREKDVTLAMARRLARRLEARGFEVFLTRTDDRYLALEERTAIANARGGDLFVSLHANAHPRRDRRGVETYVLDVTGDRYSARLAARENGLADLAAGAEVRRVLADLDAKSSSGPSRRLAALVQRELCAGLRAGGRDVRDLGVKSALFYVLLGARMPAVLVETSFISNRVEERRLASPRFQEEVAAGVARAVAAYAEGEARVASAGPRRLE